LRTTPTTLLKTLPECLDGETPVAVRLIDIEQGTAGLRLPANAGGSLHHRLVALVRRDGLPLGWTALEVSADGTVSLDGLAAAGELAAGPHEAPGGLPIARGGPHEAPGGLPGAPGASPYAPGGSPGASGGPPDAPAGLLSVVVTTCANVEQVISCVEAIRACGDEALEIVVVENRPVLSTLERTLEERFGGDRLVHYVEEHRRGLSRARNAGLGAARGDIVAFTDDDIVVDRAWVRALRTAFVRSPSVDCVTGLILPFELETPTQVLAERFASFGKGFSQRTYTLEDPPLDQPLFPYTAGYFGSGANMAFRTAVIRDLGGFDPALGAGTRTRGGEDLDICIRLLRAGRRLAYEPGAIVWHRHPNTLARLRQQVLGYGIGLGAMLTKQIIVGPDRWSIVSRAPQGIRYFMDPGSRKNAARGAVFPRSLSRLERIGVAYGPFAYMAGCLGRSR
jgi:GT2 family glycosyltransferase